VLEAGTLFTALGGDYVQVGSLCSLVYALGLMAKIRDGSECPGRGDRERRGSARMAGS